MAQITVNEVSNNYTYSVGNNNFATVALPIAASWGPGFYDPTSMYSDEEAPTFEEKMELELEDVVWQRFAATQAGMEQFVSTYRGATSNYRLAKDYSYQTALTLLSQGYDVLTCRLSPGNYAQSSVMIDVSKLSEVPPTTDPGSGDESLISLLSEDGTDTSTEGTPEVGTNPEETTTPEEGGEDSTTKPGETPDGGEENPPTSIPSTPIVKPDTIPTIPLIPAIKNGEPGTFVIKAKYPGTFGNQLFCSFGKARNKNYWNLTVYVIDSSGVHVAVETNSFVFDIDNSTDSILHIDEIESSYVTLITTGELDEDSKFVFLENGQDIKSGITFSGGTDTAETSNLGRSNDTIQSTMVEAATLAYQRFNANKLHEDDDPLNFDYIYQLMADGGLKYENGEFVADEDKTPVLDDLLAAQTIKYREWLFRFAPEVYELLKDRLAYNPNRVISPGWDDIDISFIGGQYIPTKTGPVMDYVSPIHIVLMNTAYYSRCATAYLDVPKCLPRKDVYSDDEFREGYAQLLSRYEPENAAFETNGSLFSTHSALFAPWGQYKYVGTSKYNAAPPSFFALLIQHSMIKNQSLQYEWIMPSSRIHDIKVNKLAYKIPKKVMDVWQPTDQEGGVGVNVITEIPGLGAGLWGNSTLFENPPATYQALRNLSTRHLVCALEDVIYKAGIGITFRYNNSEAYSAFYAGVVPTLDTMRNAGAIEDYRVQMAQDLDALGMVKANSVVGKIWIVPVGVIESITVDLIALPPGTDLSTVE